jgi:hypothetical protein
VLLTPYFPSICFILLFLLVVVVLGQFVFLLPAFVPETACGAVVVAFVFIVFVFNADESVVFAL